MQEVRVKLYDWKSDERTTREFNKYLGILFDNQGTDQRKTRASISIEKGQFWPVE